MSVLNIRIVELLQVKQKSFFRIRGILRTWGRCNKHNFQSRKNQDLFDGIDNQKTSHVWIEGGRDMGVGKNSNPKHFQFLFHPTDNSQMQKLRSKQTITAETVEMMDGCVIHCESQFLSKHQSRDQNLKVSINILKHSGSKIITASHLEINDDQISEKPKNLNWNLKLNFWAHLLIPLVVDGKSFSPFKILPRSWPKKQFSAQ